MGAHVYGMPVVTFITFLMVPLGIMALLAWWGVTYDPEKLHDETALENKNKQ